MTQNVEAFRTSLEQPEPPAGSSPPLVALWHAARGDLDKAHRAIVDEETAAAAWVRAHLHRRAGDTASAGDWYTRAGRQEPVDAIDDEWDQIAYALMLNR